MRNYKRKSSRLKWDEKDMLKAIYEVEQNHISYEDASVLFNVPVGTLYRRVQKVKKGYNAVKVCGKSKFKNIVIKNFIIILLYLI